MRNSKKPAISTHRASTLCCLTNLLFVRLKGMSVDDFLGAGFMEGDNDEVWSS